jgi:hypothetical protein
VEFHENDVEFHEVSYKVSGVSREKARASLKPDTRHLKPMLGEGFITPDNVQKKELFS